MKLRGRPRAGGFWPLPNLIAGPFAGFCDQGGVDWR